MRIRVNNKTFEHRKAAKISKVNVEPLDLCSDPISSVCDATVQRSENIINDLEQAKKKKRSVFSRLKFVRTKT